MNVKFYRNKVGLTQFELAEKVGVTGNYITLIETGKKVPSIKTLHEIAGQLDITANNLISRDPLFEELRKLSIEYGIEEIAEKLKSLKII